MQYGVWQDGTLKQTWIPLSLWYFFIATIWNNRIIIVLLLFGIIGYYPLSQAHLKHL